MKKVILLIFSVFLFYVSVFGQEITTGSLEGKITDNNHQPLANASVLAVHIPSGTKYGAVTRADGRYTILGMRIGGPYVVNVSFLGYTTEHAENIFISLGSASLLNFQMHEISYELEEGVVYGKSDHTFSSDRTGAATSISSKIVQSLPTVNRSLSDFLRLTPQFKNGSFVGQNDLLNNLTVDGSSFNNSFGLAGQPGERTGVAPISIDALEQIQINVAPFDVRQANFVGAAVNMVTKSGTNEFKSSAYYQTRNQAFIGTKAAGSTFDPGTFNFNMGGTNFSGPVIKDKLFYFLSLELENYVNPATTFVANDGTTDAGGNVTRVLKSDLDGLSSFLKKNFGYNTGGYEGYDFNTKATRFIIRLDYNLNIKNKISVRYNYLDSKADHLMANSNVLGYGYRRGTINSLNFQNSNFAIVENIRSIIAEWNSVLRDNISNKVIAGYRFHDESRDNPGKLFPSVDILKDGATYTSFGTEPYSPYNSLTYSSFQLQDNLSIFLKNHTLLFGLNIEKYKSRDCFFPGAQSVYVYNSLEDFYTDANGYLSDPGRTESSVNLKRFQYRYSNIPGQERPVQLLKVLYSGIYAQDKWNITDYFKLTFGIRLDIPFFGNTGYRNEQVEGLTFKDENGRDVRYSTDKLPNAKPLFSPRIGFNWDIFKNNTTRLRGGSGIFTGQPAYVWISNQIGNNGILTGYQRLDGSGGSPLYSRPFNPNTDTYKPATVTGEPASSYELALTDPNFKFPQIWRTNLAVDRKLPFDIVGSVDFIYDKDVNSIYFFNANFPEPDSYFNGPDNRPRWTSGNTINPNIINAIVLKNHHMGYGWNISASLEKKMRNGLYGKAGYSYGIVKNAVDPTSVASGSWEYNAQSGNPNKPGISYASTCPDGRLFTALLYKSDYFKIGSTTLSVFFESYANGRESYVYSGDMNGDNGSSNDLIYIPKDKSEMFFKEYTSDGTTYSEQDQQDAWEQYIEQDKYLRKHRGRYAERNGVVLPTITRLDFSITQELTPNIFGRKNGFIIRMDIFNLTNLLNNKWGVGQELQTNLPLLYQGTDSDGRPVYNLRDINGKLIDKSYTHTASLDDVYKIQLSVKWMFNL